jgi:hypothetical protein
LWRSVLLLEETGNPENTIHISQVTDNLYHILLYSTRWSRFELTTSVVISTDCIGESCWKWRYTLSNKQTNKQTNKFMITKAGSEKAATCRFHFGQAWVNKVYFHSMICHSKLISLLHEASFSTKLVPIVHKNRMSFMVSKCGFQIDFLTIFIRQNDVDISM